MKNEESGGASIDEKHSEIEKNRAGVCLANAGAKRIPPPASLAIGPLTRLGRDRVRSVLHGNQAWTFNYSIIKLDAPDLAKILNEWLVALKASISPLTTSSIELTFARPLSAGTPTQDGTEAFETFAHTCYELINRVGSKAPITISLFWSARFDVMSDCLNDWQLDLDPIRADVNQAAEQLINDLGSWLEGLDSFSMNFDLTMELEHSASVRVRPQCARGVSRHAAQF